ncbi:hypothetical protein EI94DRAFT_1795286 [Lactarius quietus]|nr:hypothetical protein EI94DRAFT_1795286 [Lactarius quietus]
MPLVKKHGVLLKIFPCLMKMLEEECVDLKESIEGMIKEMCKKKASSNASSKTPTPTPSHSKSLLLAKSALHMHTTSLLPSHTSSMEHKGASLLSDISALENNNSVFPPETPSKCPFTTLRIIPIYKKAESSPSEEDTRHQMHTSHTSLHLSLLQDHQHPGGPRLPPHHRHM